MAKILDKLYNRVIEGKLIELSNEDLEALKSLGISKTPSYELGSEEEIDEDLAKSLRVGDTLSIMGSLYLVTYVDNVQFNMLELDSLGSLELNYYTYDKVSKDLSSDTFNIVTSNDISSKLYKHQLELVDEEDVSHNVTVICRKSIQLTMSDFVNESDDIILVVNSVTTDATSHKFAISQLYMDNDELFLFGYFVNQDSVGFIYITRIASDVVTPY